MKLFTSAWLKILACIASVMILVGCGNSAHVPVSDARASGKSTSSKATGQRYVIQKGDTLFGIAFRYDLDYRKLAQANKIPHPYRIFPGDVIVLREAAAPVARKPVASSNNKKPATTSAQKAPAASKPAISSTANKPANSNGATKPTVSAQATQNNAKNSQSASNQKKPVVENEKAQQFTRNNQWIWPVTGKIERFFSADGLSKGLDIVAAVGTPVRSARDGQVIYAGSRLKGYGNLIIIRHDDVYLSAYAHNRVILVEEGQVVKQGDKIAELGMSGTQTPKLHFEIRKGGKPIDPMEMLPRQ